MNVGLHSRTDFTVLSVYFGALHWCFGESGCLGDRSIKPKGSLMIGRNIPLILSGVPCLLLRNVQNGNNEVMFCFLFFFPPFIHVDIFCINYVAALFLVLAGGDGGFVMKDSTQTGCSHSLIAIGFFSTLHSLAVQT